MIAPISLLSRKPLPHSFVLGRTECRVKDAAEILRNSIGCVNSKAYRRHPALSIICEHGELKRIEITDQCNCQFRFRRGKHPKWHRPIDFNLIDFGEELPA